MSSIKSHNTCSKGRQVGQAVSTGLVCRMRLYLDLTVDKQLLHSLPVSLMQTCVMHADPKGQRQLQVGIPYCGNDILYLQTNQSTDDDRHKYISKLTERLMMTALRLDLLNHVTVNYTKFVKVSW